MNLFEKSLEYSYDLTTILLSHFIDLEKSLEYSYKFSWIVKRSFTEVSQPKLKKLQKSDVSYEN